MTVLYHAKYGGDVQILERIWKWANVQMTKEELNKFLLAQGDERRTAWYGAANRGNLEVLEKLWEWAKEFINCDELKNKLLLAEDDDGMTALHHATYRAKYRY